MAHRSNKRRAGRQARKEGRQEGRKEERQEGEGEPSHVRKVIVPTQALFLTGENTRRVDERHIA